MSKQQALATLAPEQPGYLVGVTAEAGQQVGTLQPVFTQLIISANPDAQEVFPVGATLMSGGNWEERLALTKSSLEMIAQGLGVVWDVSQTGAQSLSRDYVLYRAVGSYHNPDGSITPLIGTKELDMEVLEMEIRLNQLRKIAQDKILQQKGWSWKNLDRNKKSELRKRAGNMLEGDLTEREQLELEHKIQGELVQLRQHKVGRAETGAKNRAIRSLGIKSTYSEQELAQPFNLVKWQLNPGREEVQRMSLDLWGGPDQHLPEGKPQVLQAPQSDSEPSQGAQAQEQPQPALERQEMQEAEEEGDFATMQARAEEEGEAMQELSTAIMERLALDTQVPADQKASFIQALKATTELETIEGLYADLVALQDSLEKTSQGPEEPPEPDDRSGDPGREEGDLPF
jgi:hypothetical protein|tara:strand:- start:2174 stop:3376 length:1203 start_codon:yes stop_codon:yes gene_type:complete